MKMNNKGFTLIEVMIAVAIIAIGLLAMQTMQGSSVDNNVKSGNISTKSMLASSKIEEILNLNYHSPLLDDTDNDGTNQDGDGDGIDDQDNGNPNDTLLTEDFGLRHSECCLGNVSPRGAAVAGCVAVADQCDFYEDFEIYWNVAVDYPVDNTKTIRIIVVDPADKLRVDVNQNNRSAVRAEYTYIKDDVI